MKIFFERSGGFAGLRLVLNLELAALHTDDAAALQKLVNDADFFHLPDPVTGSGFSDGFQYSLRIEQDDIQRTMQFSDGSLPEKLLPLINDLSLRARMRRRSAK